MGNAASWAATAGNKFRQASKASDDPALAHLAEGLTALAEAVRELDHDLGNMDRRMAA